MKKILSSAVNVLMILSIVNFANRAFAHCDTMDGPVIKDAQAALASGNSMPVLKWVSAERENEVLLALDRALTARRENPDLADATDMRFFETLVTVHREGEGEHFEGIKPAGTPLEPGIGAADEAIALGTADHLIDEITNSLAQGIRERFNRVVETKKHKDDSVEAGREYVAAYVDFMHYVEGVHGSVSKTTAAHHEHAGH